MNYSAKPSINMKHNASWQWSCIKWFSVVSGLYLLLFGVPGSLFNFLVPTALAPEAGTGYGTAIVVLGGGLTSTGQLPPHSQLRVKKAEQLYRQLQSAGSGTAPAIITLSGGTTHKPNPHDARGFPIWEASAAARDLAQIGIDPLHIYEENFSLDTVGNAYFLRTIHTEPSNIRNLEIVTNDWHMERTRAIFEHVFSLPWDTPTERSISQIQDRIGVLPMLWSLAVHVEKIIGFGPRTNYQLTFHAVGSGIADEEVLKLRMSREQASLSTFLSTTKHQFQTMAELRQFLYQQHNAYAAKRLVAAAGGSVGVNHTASDGAPADISAELLKTY